MKMSARINELQSDLDELNNLLQSAKRKRCLDLLALEIRKIQNELLKLQNEVSIDQENVSSRPVANSTSKNYVVKLNNYAWDQTDNFVKLYVTLKNVQTLPKEAVTSNFTERSVDLHVAGLEGKDYVLPINNLSEDIDANKSYIKIKTDMVIVYLAKVSKKTWSYITSVEKRIKESKTTTPNIDKNEDPGACIMNLMKKMYQEGDDEMKKVIAKAWTESQDKKQSELGGLPDL